MANWGFLIEFMVFILPIWTSFLIGIMVGWAWKPSWSNKIKFESFLSKIVEFSAQNSSSSSSSNCNGFSSISQSCKVDEDVKSDNGNSFSYGNASCSSSKLKGTEIPVVNDSDLIHLHKVAEEKDGGPSWIQMMDRSTPNMSYRAWRRDPPTGPPQYRSSTIYEDVTPELMKDFFWDDEFRSEWDTMLIHHETLDASKTTGTMIVKWIRKFPFFCSDREYIIGRRVWECGQTFYCVTKGIPNNVPRKNKPRRVDLYYSSWCIRAAESKRTGQMTACEVLLFHHEDMGIPWEIAKLGVRQGMWGAVKMIDPGLRAYQKARGASDAPLSPSATMAHITTKVSPQYLKSVSSGDNDVSVTEVIVPSDEKPHPVGMNVPKLLVFGGAVALACSLDRGLLTKAVIFGVARKLGRVGGKL